ncbi:MAG TPA: hypothetical protein VFR68_14535 [Candidatus Dormibacteraeota bacterium]|nr:hypothetical protein [Candidatus Dormibacteraeota bacterium]
MLTFELLSKLESRLLQKPTTGGYLIRRRRFVLAGERAVEDVHIVVTRFARLLLLGSIPSMADQKSHGGR